MSRLGSRLERGKRPKAIREGALGPPSLRGQLTMTQAILTKYIPATNTRPSRIKAWTASRKQALVRPYDDGTAYRDAFERHLAVARELAARQFRLALPANTIRVWGE